MRMAQSLMNCGKVGLPSILCLVVFLFFVFLGHSGRLNCMIIHLGALIYPLPVALNVGLFCEAALRISNEPTAQSVSLSEGAHLRPHSLEGLWANVYPYVEFFTWQTTGGLHFSCQLYQLLMAKDELGISCFPSAGTRGPHITTATR